MKYTYRQLFTKHLPEPYRSQAIANAVAQDGPNRVDDPSETSGIDPDNLDDALSSAFAWSDTPEGHDYWSNAAKGLFPAARTPIPEPGDRLADLESRVAVLEGLVSSPGVADAPPEPGRDPGEGYRLLEEGEHFVDGDEEARSEECRDWSRVHPRRHGEKFCSEHWFPVRRKIAGPTYRLLNPGEIIRETDEMYVRGVWKWEPAEDDAATGLPFDPSWQHPIRRLLKSYEDA